MKENISKNRKTMADKEVPQPQHPKELMTLSAPQNPPPSQNPQVPLIPNAPQVPPAPEAPHLPAPYVSLLNWSHFKPGYSRKPDKDQKLTYLGQMLDRHRQISGPC